MQYMYSFSPVTPFKSAYKKIYIIRHGETEFNKLGVVQGSGIDSNLNELGWLQAQAFHHHYKHIKFDKVYTSALRRTHQTVSPFLKQGITWETLKGLNELCWGNKEGRILTPQDDAEHFAMLEGWKRGEVHLKPVGGESPLEVMQRQKRALSYIMNQTEEENVLVCMHGRAMRIFLCLLLQEDLKSMDKFEHSNLSLYVVKYENGRFQIENRDDRKHLQSVCHERMILQEAAF
jgi:probable phosphoglycerate mutase